MLYTEFMAELLGIVPVFLKKYPVSVHQYQHILYICVSTHMFQCLLTAIVPNVAYVKTIPTLERTLCLLLEWCSINKSSNYYYRRD